MARFSHFVVRVTFIFLSSFSYAEYPGVTPGSFSVSDSGAANYTLPISVPAGVAGMSPELAVTYSSQGGNGILGVGFQLSGYSSSIHRCGGSHVVDGHASGVQYTNADKLCLNGQRLILVNGTHWGNGAEYRTEVESFSKIIYNTDTSGGTFTVYTKEGEIHHYTHRFTVSASGLAAGKNVKAWPLRYMRDRSGNQIKYRYKSTNGERWLPIEVAWGGKTDADSNRKLIFEYRENPRPDQRISYERGYKSHSKHLLHKIIASIDGNQVNEYRFTYQKSPVSGLSRLRYVQQCGSAGDCLPRHEFQWNDTNKGFYSSNAYKLPVRVYDDHDIRSGSSCGNWNVCKDGYVVEVKRGDFLDINNDGYVDFIESVRGEDSKTWYRRIYQNTGSGWSKRSQVAPILIRDYYTNRGKSSVRGEMVQQAIYADVNGDGYPDIVRSFRNNSTSIREVRLNNQGNSFSWGSPSANNFTPPDYMFDYVLLGKGKLVRRSDLIDVNGDGLPDWVTSYATKDGKAVKKTWLNTGSKWVYNAAYNPPSFMRDYRGRHNIDNAEVTRSQWVDLNGDGLVDYITSVKYPDRGDYGDRTYNYAVINTGQGWRGDPSYKLPDIITDYSRLDKRTYVHRWITGPDLPQRRGDFIDVNGDGLVDWVRSFADGVNGKVHKKTWLNTGKGWVANTAYNLPGKVMRSYHHTQQGDPHGTEVGSFLDINRDGLVDWVVAHRNRDNQIVKQTFLNTGTGWSGNNSAYHFPNILIDNDRNEAQVPMHFGGIMDLNGDGALDYLMSTKPMVGSDIVRTYLGRAKPADMVVKVIDSIKAETTIAYKPMTNNTVYRTTSALPEENFRSRKVIGAMPLVSDTWQSNGVGGSYQLKYFYYNLLDDGKRGNLGYYERRIWDKQQGTVSLKRLYQEFPVTGMLRNQYLYKADGVTEAGWLSGNHELIDYQVNYVKRVPSLDAQGSLLDFDKQTHASGNKTYAPRIRRTRKSDYELGQGHIRSTWTNITYDAFVNPVEVTTATIYPYTSYENIDWENTHWNESQTTYQNDETNWLIGLPSNITVTHHAPGKDKQVRETVTQYNTIGLPETTIIEPNRPEFRLTTSHSYDEFGNVVNTTVSGQGIVPRTSSVEYDTQGLHIIQKTNAKDQIISETHHDRCDAVETMTDVNGLQTTLTFDQFCRVARVDYPDGTWKTTTFGFTPLRTIDRAKGQPEMTSYYDSLGRIIKTETQGFDGRMVVAEKRYNHKGQITEESAPYYAGNTAFWTRYYYDEIGRLYLTRARDGGETSVSYNGLTTVTTNALGQTQTRTVDIAGRLQTVLDTQNNAIHYDYDAVGNLLSTTDPVGNQVKMGYDHAGRKIWMNDPDMGIWNYEYDVLGQLIKQTDATGQEITTDYDILGRMTQRTVQPGTVDEQVSSWTYDTAVNGVGKLDQTNGPNGYSRRHTYDNLSRPHYTHEAIDGLSMVSHQRYNTDGKVAEVGYPVPEGVTGFSDRLTYSYNDFGYLNKVSKYVWNDGAPINEDLWVLEDINARGGVKQERYGTGVSIQYKYAATRDEVKSIHSLFATGVSGTGQLTGTSVQDLHYSWDKIGNLTYREDAVQNINETFWYDDLNRLTQTTASIPDPTNPDGVSPTITEYQYDLLGNITYRSDVGTMHYGENGYGPHALTSIQQNQSTNVTENVFNPYGSYNYDANGNLTNNGQRTVDWTAFNKPRQMAGFINGEARGASYTYGSDFQRITKTTLAGKTTRYYSGGAMEHITEGDQTLWKHYIPVGTATLEIKYEQTDSAIAAGSFTEVEKQYLFKDHLGSTDVIVDNDGTVKERLSFNPWGERRDSDWTEADGEISSSSNRGFTGHEMDDEIGLINMNARIYDPVIGRFLSPDALIPSPTDLQSYNRYSYVRNNPLSFTDPSGSFRVVSGVRSGLSLVSGAFSGSLSITGGNSNAGKGLSAVPGTGGYKYGNGAYYAPYKAHECCFGRGDNYRWNTYYKKVSDPGLINQLNTRIGVANEIIDNYGGLSRGNAKDARNSYRALAAAELAANGKTGHYRGLLNRAAAAGSIYLDLKHQARKRYRRTAFKLAMTVLAGQGIAGLEAGASQVAAHSASSFVLSGGDVKTALGALVTAGLGGPLKGITNVDSVLGIAAHGVVGGVVSEIQGGGFVEGFAAGAVGKSITLGADMAFNTGGDFHLGQFGATVAGAALVAELAGGDAVLGALQAAGGYLFNHSGVNEYAGQKVGHDAVRSPMDRPPHSHDGGFDMNVNQGFAGPRELIDPAATVGCAFIGAQCIRAPTPHDPFCYAGLACAVNDRYDFKFPD